MARRGETPEPETEATFTGREALWEQAVATYFEAIPRPANTGIDSDGEHEPWRTKEKKMKTLSVGVLLCLNIGVAPPGTVRPNPCAVLECWIDPTSMPPAKAIESIGTRLQEQYVRWQPKAKCKMALDPTLDDIKKVCCSLRRRAKEEPALLHYNGHGVPRPTVNGELWVFNKNYTQYLPVSVYDLQTWMGSPSIFVYDCPGAAIIVGAFDNYAQQRAQEYEKKKSSGSRMGNVPEPLADCIQLAACGASETLPTHPDLPADLFTSCLTTPMETALRWVFTTQHHKMLPRVTLSMIERLPGQLNDRRTMRGQLNWIFTAITDTIAWNVLPSDLFHKLFRNDLLVAALFRNFLLAERVMRSANCTPVSSPKLPPTHDHPLWQAWDMAVDYCMTQLPNILQNNAEFEHCPFFSDQLTAFEVWLEMEAHGEERKPPEQLPVVLQVLLSQQHRLRALELLERFLGLGPWAVRKALSVGIFPYVFKLLGSPAQELRPVLVSIWAKILAVDSECKMDLMKPPASVARKPASSSVSDKGFMYFVRTLAGRFEPKLRTRAAYVLATFVSENRKGQEVCLDAGLMSVTLPQLQCEDANLRQWLCLLLGQLWFKFDNARSFALQEKVLPALIDMLQDPVPKVRASAVFAMGTLVGSNIDAAGSVAAEPGKERDLNIDQIGMCLASSVLEDGSHSVRAEVVAAFCPIVLLYQNQFVSTATRMKEAKQKGRNSDRIERLLRALFYLSNDPYPDVSEAATSLLATIGIKTARKATISSKGSAKRSVNVPAHMTIRSPSPRNSFSQSWSLSGSMAAGQPSPGIMMIPDTETHICGLLNTVIGLADSLDSDTPGGSELTETDVQTALRLQVMSVLDALPHLRPMLDSYGWTGVSFDGTLTSQRLRDLAMALESATNWQRNGELDLFCISSRLFSWSCASFCTWTQKEHGETPVAALERRDWRMERNTERRCEAFDVISNHKSLKLDEMMFFTRVGRVADSIVFHPYEPLVIMANQDDGVISVWNTEHPDAEFNSFSNGSPPSARITALKLVNDFDESLLAVGTSDGVVRLWQEYWTESPTLLTAWKAASKMLDAKEGQGAGLVLEWNQQSGHLLASGDVPYIQLWDCATETRVQRLSTSVRSCVTSMCVDKTNTSIVATGYGNGLIKIFDLRTCSSVQQYEQHKSFVLNVHRQHGGQRCLVSGSKAGDVLWWDERFAGAAVRSLTAYQMRKDDTMTAMAVHSHASLLAVASRKQCIKVYDLDGELLNHHRHYMNFLADPIGPTSCLAFHPFQPFLASCSYEQLVSIYAPTL